MLKKNQTRMEVPTLWEFLEGFHLQKNDPREMLDSIGGGLEEVAVVKCHGVDHSK